jgi:hypothetical protein
MIVSDRRKRVDEEQLLKKLIYMRIQKRIAEGATEEEILQEQQAMFDVAEITAGSGITIGRA